MASQVCFALQRLLLSVRGSVLLPCLEWSLNDCLDKWGPITVSEKIVPKQSKKRNVINIYFLKVGKPLKTII